MTVHEKTQQEYKKYESFGKGSLPILKSKTFEIEVKDRSEYEDYTVEFVVEDVYTFMGDMMAFDIKVKSFKNRYHINKVDAVEFKKNNTNTFRRVTNVLKEEFGNKFKRDLMVKSTLYSISIVHLNNITV